jgi:hypothetical protein
MNTSHAVAPGSLTPAPSIADRPPVADAEAPLERDAAWDDERLFQSISENAYYRAERRGFMPGEQLTDWLAAEQEVLATAARISR